MKTSIIKAFALLDPFMSFFAFISGLFLRALKRVGLHHVPFSRRALAISKCFPVIDHYYEPYINAKSLEQIRDLPGIDFNNEAQLNLLEQFNYQDEILKLPRKEVKDHKYFFNNDAFDSGDGEILYNMIRHFKPKKYIEVGSGFSTLMAIDAFKKNDNEHEIICIELMNKIGWNQLVLKF